MKTTKLIWNVLCVAVLAAFSLVGCQQLELYTIDTPSDLQSRVDSIAAEKSKINTGDTTYINIATPLVGPEDNSAGWWAHFSDYFTIPVNKLLVLEFINNGTGENNWNNWNLAVTNDEERTIEGDDGEEANKNYKEYFVLRSDAFGWGGGMGDEGYPYDGVLISHNYADVIEGEDMWAGFREIMQGAYVTLEVDHSATGNVFVTATAVGKDGSILIQTYNQPVSASADIKAFLICDGSSFEMKNAYLLPSQVSVIADEQPVSIAVTGAPESLEIGNEDFWGDAIATVTFADGSSALVDTADVTFVVIPDMTSLGNKTVLVAYSKTKQGNYGQAVSTVYNFEVTNSVVNLEITAMPLVTTYYFVGDESPAFNKENLVVTATYSDGTTGIIPNANLKFAVLPTVDGNQNLVISYEGSTSTVSVDCPVTMVEGVKQVGLTDMTTGWWTAFSDDYAVASGTSKTVSMVCYSNNLNNWHSPCTILRKADMAEYAVTRMDNFGWGAGYDGRAIPTSDWNWDIFGASINGSKVDITVTNNGDDTATVYYDVTYQNGDKHFQQYENIEIVSADLNFAFVVEGAYLIIIE